MYKLYVANLKTEKILKNYLDLRKGISKRLDRLRENPYKNCGAHKLHGRFKDKYACWLGANIRMIYSIKDKENLIIVEAVGGHKIY